MSFIGKTIGKAMELSAKPFGYLTGAEQAAKAAKKAGKVQERAAMAGIEEQRRQFDKLIELMSPYVAVGAPALEQQQAMIGLRGPEAEQAAIAALAASPQLQALAQQGENAILQQASATGGLRGGNVQAALAQFRPQLLQQLIEQRYGQLGGLAGIGQAAAAGQAAQGMTFGTNVSNSLANAAAARAGGIISQGNVQRQVFGDALKVAGAVASFM